MLSPSIVVATSLLYLGLLFGLASLADRRADQGRSVVGRSSVYALSLAVYCTAWTFFGSVGRAAMEGVSFLTIYLGPTLTLLLGASVLRKMVRISRYHRLTSIADFVASRYGKSQLIGGLVTVIAVAGTVPYIALQLKAVSDTFGVLTGTSVPGMVDLPLSNDTGFYAAVILAIFAILFGTRHLDATERHEGMVAAIAFEAVVKLVAFLAVGVFVTFAMYDGVGDLFSRAAARADLQPLFVMPTGAQTYSEWAALLVLSMGAVLLLPRQFQVAVVENVDERHVLRAVWLFPLYLLLINLFVLPIALGGLLYFPDGSVDADTFVLTLPLAEGHPVLALLVFIGGLSAATGMVIVATVALATMISNDLVMPTLLRVRGRSFSERGDLGLWVLRIRRGAILAVVLLGYLYFRLVADTYALVSIGLVAFAAAAQFAPVVLGGMYWKRGTRAGAACALVGGVLVWSYTLPLPALVQASGAAEGFAAGGFVAEGLFGWGALRPHALFGLDALSPIAHGTFWSLLVNASLYVGVSLFTRQGVLEHAQAVSFVDIDRFTAPRVAAGAAGATAGRSVWRGTAHLDDLRALLRRFLGARRADLALDAYLASHPLDEVALDADASLTADADLVHHAEALLAAAIGSASARAMIATVVREEPVRVDEVLAILDEQQKTLAYSRTLEEKSAELQQQTERLEAARNELVAVNRALREVDRLRDEFVSTVTHELRTPLTSIRAFAEIMQATPDLDPAQRAEFLGIVVAESERLSRLIGDVLTFQKLNRNAVPDARPLDLEAEVQETIRAVRPLFSRRGTVLDVDAPPQPCRVEGDADQVRQVLYNLLANAAKHADRALGHVRVRIAMLPDPSGGPPLVRLDVSDNGHGIHPSDHERIFGAFEQARHRPADQGEAPGGTGLGLAISRRIVRAHGGELWVESDLGEGATFSFTLPLLVEHGAKSDTESSEESATPRVA
ncbi:MAG: sensor histidine kinase [Bacteroidota bacterium]